MASGAGDQRGGEQRPRRGGGPCRWPARGRRAAAAAPLIRTSVCGVLGHVARHLGGGVALHEGDQLVGDRLGGVDQQLGVADGLEAARDEVGGEQGPGGGAQQRHGLFLPCSPGPSQDRPPAGNVAAMCGRYASTASPAQLAEEFDVDDILDGLPGPDYNVAPTVRRARGLRAGRQGERRRPPPAGPAGLGTGAVVGQGPGDRLPDDQRPARDGGREAGVRQGLPQPGAACCPRPASTSGTCRRPRAGGRKPAKQPFFLHRADGGLLVMAGIYEIWRDPTKDRDDDSAWLRTCSVITTAGHRRGRAHPRPDAAGRARRRPSTAGWTPRSPTPSRRWRCSASPAPPSWRPTPSRPRSTRCRTTTRRCWSRSTRRPSRPSTTPSPADAPQQDRLL